MRQVLLASAIAALWLATGSRAQFLSGDIRSVDTPDAMWNHERFTARCVAPSGECYVQRQQFGTNVDVYATVADFQQGLAPLRTVVFPSLVRGGQMCWANGRIYATTTVAGGPLQVYDPVTGAPFPTALTAGTATIQWGGGIRVLVCCDGNYIYLNKDNVVEVYDLSETFLRSVTLGYTINDLGTGFAAGRYYYPVDYNGLGGVCAMTQRINADTGTVEPWSDVLAGVPACPYLTCASFDYFFNRLLHTCGNAQSCQDTSFLYNDVLQGGPMIRTVDTVPTQVAPGQNGIAVTMDVENVGPNLLAVNSVDLVFFDPGLVDVSSDYTVTADPGNPTAIASGATETFSFTVDVAVLATPGVITVDGAIDTTDQVTMATMLDAGADTPDTWEVMGAVPRVRTVDAPDPIVGQGSGGYPVTVTVENVGLLEMTVGTVSLSFTGVQDRTSEYTVTPSPGNPALIAAGATESFLLSVDVSPAASLEVIILDAAIDGTTTLSGLAVDDPDADVRDTWTVVVCHAPACGDCNGDQVIDILDALVAAQHAAVMIFLTGSAFSSCNVTGPLQPSPGAVVDVLDALVIAQYAAAIPISLACC